MDTNYLKYGKKYGFVNSEPTLNGSSVQTVINCGCDSGNFILDFTTEAVDLDLLKTLKLEQLNKVGSGTYVFQMTFKELPITVVVSARSGFPNYDYDLYCVHRGEGNLYMRSSFTLKVSPSSTWSGSFRMDDGEIRFNLKPNGRVQDLDFFPIDPVSYPRWWGNFDRCMNRQLGTIFANDGNPVWEGVFIAGIPESLLGLYAGCGFEATFL